ncbi:MAG TPA: sugar ABC transporter permease [Candidatus Merdivicinus faecavium]|nr:sugar ABC transporter permease [Candidatus Merdivicinus faecavium]
MAAKTKKRKFSWTRDDTELTLLCLPTTVWYALFCFLPMFGIIIAFKHYTVTAPDRSFFYNLLVSPNAGFDNFTFIFQNGGMWDVVKLTLFYNIIFQILGILVPVTLALLMSQLYSKRYGKICQTCMFFPHFMSWVVVTYFVYAFLSTDNGLVNSILENLGQETKNWYVEKSFWPVFLIFLNTWKGMGYGMVVYLASITGIDATMYEAALIDGATKWQQTRYITLPHLKSIVIMMFILNIGGLVRSDFGLFYQVPRASGSLTPVTNTIDVYIYNALKTQFSPDMASAASFLQSIIGCCLILLSNWIISKIDADSAII